MGLRATAERELARMERFELIERFEDHRSTRTGVQEWLSLSCEHGEGREGNANIENFTHITVSTASQFQSSSSLSTKIIYNSGIKLYLINTVY